MPEHEPTLYDVIDIIKSMDTRMETGFSALNNRMGGMDTGLVTVERSVSKLNVTIALMADRLEDGVDTVEGHSHKIKIHDRRISKLEKEVAR